jgi:hypothetical protein
MDPPIVSDIEINPAHLTRYSCQLLSFRLAPVSIPEARAGTVASQPEVVSRTLIAARTAMPERSGSKHLRASGEEFDAILSHLGPAARCKVLGAVCIVQRDASRIAAGIAFPIGIVAGRGPERGSDVALEEVLDVRMMERGEEIGIRELGLGLLL